MQKAGATLLYQNENAFATGPEGKGRRNFWRRGLNGAQNTRRRRCTSSPKTAGGEQKNV